MRFKKIAVSDQRDTRAFPWSIGASVCESLIARSCINCLTVASCRSVCLEIERRGGEEFIGFRANCLRLLLGGLFSVCCFLFIAFRVTP